LRAVLRKDSWIFCAGLFSIADLLGPDYVFPLLSPDHAGCTLRWRSCNRRYSIFDPQYSITRQRNVVLMRTRESLYASAQCCTLQWLYDTALLPTFQAHSIPETVRTRSEVHPGNRKCLLDSTPRNP
jgi:hypothetical protein